MHKARILLRLFSVAVAFILMAASAYGSCQWYRGNTHTHTWRSDGDSPPEIVISRYKEDGYNFLVLSDHNIAPDREKWIVPKKARAREAKAYEADYGPDWIKKREQDGETAYQVKTLAELRPRFEEPGRFLLIPGEEISTSEHFTVINLAKVIPPQSGHSVQEVIEKNIDAVSAQRETTGQPMLVQLNHPTRRRSIKLEDYGPIPGLRFFEVNNRGSGQLNYGDASHYSAERFWDVVLTKRLAELGLSVVYGIASDDSHVFSILRKNKDHVGHGWIMVRSQKLTPADIVSAMENGDFYASTGVILDDIRSSNETLAIDIQPRQGVTCRTQFIGTRVGYDKTVTTRPVPASRPGDPPSCCLYDYSTDIGQVLDEQAGTHVAYKMTGDEIYVRAKVISTAKHPKPHVKNEVEVAWVQPILPKKPRGSVR